MKKGEGACLMTTWSQVCVRHVLIKRHRHQHDQATCSIAVCVPARGIPISVDGRSDAGGSKRLRQRHPLQSPYCGVRRIAHGPWRWPMSAVMRFLPNPHSRPKPPERGSERPPPEGRSGAISPNQLKRHPRRTPPPFRPWATAGSEGIVASGENSVVCAGMARSVRYHSTDRTTDDPPTALSRNVLRCSTVRLSTIFPLPPAASSRLNEPLNSSGCCGLVSARWVPPRRPRAASVSKRRSPQALIGEPACTAGTAPRASASVPPGVLQIPRLFSAFQGLRTLARLLIG